MCFQLENKALLHQSLQKPNPVRAEVKTHMKHGGEEGRAEHSRKSDAQAETREEWRQRPARWGQPRAVRKVLGMEVSVISMETAEMSPVTVCQAPHCRAGQQS